jgi:TRAP-type C4-dicarboxylate transport system substrate-binding protein
MSFVVGILLASAACTAPTVSPPATEQSRTLRIATDDEPGRPAAAQIEEYARQVESLSGGKLRIEPVWKAVGHDKDDWDQEVARGVVAGDFDMGLVPARAWDTEGVGTFAALHAPFLVTSNSLLAEITASTLAGDMLAGLDTVGVTGLALFPEGTRLLFAFRQPVLSPADLEGKTVRAPRSATTYAFLEALGTTPDDLVGDLFPAGIASGDVVAAESSFAFAGSLPEPTFAAANLVLYPKANSLVANTKGFSALSDAERRTLRDAADATRAWAAEQMSAAANDAAEFCQSGGTVVNASAAEIAAFLASAAPVVAKLDADAATKASMSRIRELAAADSGPTQIMPCTPGG